MITPNQVASSNPCIHLNPHILLISHGSCKLVVIAAAAAANGINFQLFDFTISISMLIVVWIPFCTNDTTTSLLLLSHQLDDDLIVASASAVVNRQ
jgi:hypothetical protein